ncbi:MAG: hypothetical protein C0417_01855 [Chlorobiaceae bacterium]|nr:hypothetical protein [Chlorobiaceae bacterium]
MRKLTLNLSIFILLMLQSSCATVDMSQYEPGAFIIKGSIKYLEVEGGCWQFLSEDGKTFEISSDIFIDRFKNNSYAELVVHFVEDASSICMVGKLVEVLDIIHISPK